MANFIKIQSSQQEIYYRQIAAALGLTWDEYRRMNPHLKKLFGEVFY